MRSITLVSTLVALIGIVGWARLGQAQTCPEISHMTWNEARNHIYLVHAVNFRFPNITNAADQERVGQLDAVGQGNDEADAIRVRYLLGPDGTVGGHLVLPAPATQPPRVQRDGRSWLEPGFADRPQLHTSWNHLVQPPSDADSWENSFMALLEPIANFEGEMWAATPYDTMVLGPHTPGPGAILLMKQALATVAVRAHLQPFIDAGGQLQTYANDVAIRTAIATVLDGLRARPENPVGLWRILDDAGRDQAGAVIAPRRANPPQVRVASAQCPAGVQVLAGPGGVPGGGQPQFMTDLRAAGRFFGLYHGSTLDILESGGLKTRLRACSENPAAAGCALPARSVANATFPDVRPLACHAYSLYQSIPNNRGPYSISLRDTVLRFALYVDVHAQAPEQDLGATWNLVRDIDLAAWVGEGGSLRMDCTGAYAMPNYQRAIQALVPRPPRCSWRPYAAFAAAAVVGALSYAWACAM